MTAAAPGPLSAEGGSSYPALAEAAAGQPGAEATLGAALARGPVHAYLLHGPRGSGKRKVARAFAAEILARSAAHSGADAADSRRRALLDPSPHPDLIWLSPDGVQYRVEVVRERLIAAAHRSPFEGGHRVFVVEAAETMRKESQNALLKTLEEPPASTHIILIAENLGDLEPTVRSRCQPAGFRPLSPAVVEAEIRAGRPELDEIECRALARLAAGDLERARTLSAPLGESLRRAAERFATTAAGSGGPPSSEPPWKGLFEATNQAAAEAEAAAERRLEEEAELGGGRSKTDTDQILKREARRARSETLGLGLDLVAFWFRDLYAVAAGAGDLAHHADRADVLREQAETVGHEAARKATALTAEWRRRLALNVSEELALEALHSRLRRLAPPE